MTDAVPIPESDAADTDHEAGDAPAGRRAGRKPARFATRGWLGKSLAGLLLGFGLAVALAGVAVGLMPGGLAVEGAKVQFAMWLVAPIWVAVLSTCFLFASAWRAWAWLGAANLLAFGALRGLQLWGAG